MAEKKVSPYQVVLKNVRMSFPKLFTPSASVENGPLKFRGSFLIDPSTPEGKALKAQVEKVVAQLKKDTWKEKADKIRFKEGRLCAGDGNVLGLNNEGEIYDGYADMYVVSAANGKRPQIVDRDKTPLTEADGKPYGGCYVNGVVRFYATTTDKQGGPGIFASLEAVQFKSDGEAFGGGQVDVDEVFDDESGEEEDVV